MKFFKRKKKEEIDEKWLEHINGYNMLHLFSGGLDEWSLGVSQHSDTRIITVEIPPIHFDDEIEIKNKIKELIIKYNYFCHIEIHYGISSSHHFLKEEN